MKILTCRAKEEVCRVGKTSGPREGGRPEGPTRSMLGMGSHAPDMFMTHPNLEIQSGTGR